MNLIKKYTDKKETNYPAFIVKSAGTINWHIVGNK